MEPFFCLQFIEFRQLSPVEFALLICLYVMSKGLDGV